MFRRRSSSNRRRTSSRRSVSERFEIMDRTMLALVVAGITLLFALFFPRLYPSARNGPRCSDLAPPLGGNNRSVLAYHSAQNQPLDLNVKLEKERLVVGETLKIQLTFVNNDNGPVILYLNSELPAVTKNQTVQGITLEITRVDGNPVSDQPFTDRTPPQVFDQPHLLHLLGSRARCHEDFSIPINNLPAGEYRIRAFYRNNQPGNASLIRPTDATATPFPEYIYSQGVWVGNATSKEVRFSIG